MQASPSPALCSCCTNRLPVGHRAGESGGRELHIGTLPPHYFISGARSRLGSGAFQLERRHPHSAACFGKRKPGTGERAAARAPAFRVRRAPHESAIQLRGATCSRRTMANSARTSGAFCRAWPRSEGRGPGQAAPTAINTTGTARKGRMIGRGTVTSRAGRLLRGWGTVTCPDRPAEFKELVCPWSPQEQPGWRAQYEGASKPTWPPGL